MTTIPQCDTGTPGGTTLQDLTTEFYDWFEATPGDFTLGGLVGGVTPTSWWATHSDGQQHNFRISGGELLHMIDPDGTIVDSSAPGTPANASPEDVILPTPSGIAAAMSFAQYGDAVFVGVKESGLAFFEYAFHPGVIGVPCDAGDPAIGLDGLGVLAYRCEENGGSTAFDWASTQSTDSNRKSKIRLSTSIWGSPTWHVANVSSQSPGTLAGKRMHALGFLADGAGASNVSTDALKLVAKYLRIDGDSALAPLSVAPSQTTNQGWLSLSKDANASRLRILWDKSVTP